MTKHIFVGIGYFLFDLSNITVEPVLVSFLLSNILYSSAMQSFVFKEVCAELYSESECYNMLYNNSVQIGHKLLNNYLSSEALLWILKIKIFLTAPSFLVVTLFLGACGDSYGRKFPVILPCIGILAASFLGLLSSNNVSSSLSYILIGPFINGICGGSAACLMASYSYVSNISTPSNRMTRISILETMALLAQTLGLFISRAFFGFVGYAFIFSATFVIMGITLLYAVLWLDNVLPNEQETEESEDESDSGNDQKSCHSTVCFCDSLLCASKKREGNSNNTLVAQIVAVNILMLCTAGDTDISKVYLVDSLDFTYELYGFLKGFDNFVQGFIMIVVVPFAKTLIHINDFILIAIGLLSYASSFIMVGFANDKTMVFLAVVVGMFKRLPSAGLQSVMSTTVQANEQGRLFALIAASQSVITLVGEELFKELFLISRYTFPGMCYIFGAILLVIVLSLIM